ncbi:DUF4159 domain-containing protein [bacterium]|nr:DUF4159 domain-containing protein [bacterium]
MQLFFLATVALFLALSTVTAQQLPDTTFTWTPDPPAYAPGSGPLILVDAAHHNFHTADNRFRPFAILAERDGFRVASNDQPFTAKSLQGVGILVIANAVSAENERQWTVPSYPAFTTAEIAAVRAWVEQGGALLLIADHMPFGGAAQDLAAVFGFHFTNGFAYSDPAHPGPDVFRAGEGLVAEHPIATPLHGDIIDSVRTFTGQAFLADERATPLLRFPEGSVVLLPDTAWQFNELTTRLDASGWLQGATREFGQGRVAVFGEAAMFTSQLAGPQQFRVGFTSPDAPDNPQFILNVLRWLAQTH